MGVYKDNRPTKDGKIWFFKTQYEDIDGLYKTKKSGRFHTKKEAIKYGKQFGGCYVDCVWHFRKGRDPYGRTYDLWG